MERSDILCVGDSLTRGGVGWSYIPFSGHHARMVNAGRDGDTEWGVARRLPGLLASESWTACVVAVGTNDTLLPFMATRRGWRLTMGVRHRLMRCARDDVRFAARYGRLIGQVMRAGVRPVIVGLPPTEMVAYPDDEHTRRSEILRRITAEVGCPFVDVAAAMRPLTLVGGPVDRFAWSPTPVPRVVDAVLMEALPWVKDVIARRRGLRLTVDGVHWTSAAARLVAAAVDEAIASA